MFDVSKFILNRYSGTFVIPKAQNLKLIQIDIFFSCTIYQNIFTLSLTENCFLLLLYFIILVNLQIPVIIIVIVISL